MHRQFVAMRRKRDTVTNLATPGAHVYDTRIVHAGAKQVHTSMRTIDTPAKPEPEGAALPHTGAAAGAGAAALPRARSKGEQHT